MQTKKQTVPLERQKLLAVLVSLAGRVQKAFAVDFALNFSFVLSF